MLIIVIFKISPVEVTRTGNSIPVINKVIKAAADKSKITVR